MNDFERKLSQQPFRAPPLDLRDTIFGAPANVVALARWTWRDWFWPSPQAWAALAALWLIFAAVSLRDQAAEPSAANVIARSSNPLTLLTYHTARDLSNVLELSN